MHAFIPVGDRPVAYVDTETTGLSATEHEILEIAIVFDRDVAIRREIGGLIFEGDYAYFKTLVQPQRIETAHPKALEVNGYGKHPERWATAPTFDVVAERVATLLKDAILCGHNVSFDADFIQEAIRRTGSKARIDYHKVDTATLAHAQLVPCGLERLSLDTIRDFLGWEKTNAHTALKDALDARRLHKMLARATALDRAWWKWRHQVQRRRGAS